MYLIKEIYDLPFKKIGSLFGGRDHTTVMSAVEKIGNDLKNDKELKMAVDNIKKKLNILKFRRILMVMVWSGI